MKPFPRDATDLHVAAAIRKSGPGVKGPVVVENDGIPRRKAQPDLIFGRHHHRTKPMVCDQILFHHIFGQIGRPRCAGMKPNAGDLPVIVQGDHRRMGTLIKLTRMQTHVRGESLT